MLNIKKILVETIEAQNFKRMKLCDFRRLTIDILTTVILTLQSIEVAITGGKLRILDDFYDHHARQLLSLYLHN